MKERKKGKMKVILFDQPGAYRQIERGLRCRVCGEPMEAVQRTGRWFLECQSCVTVFGGFSGTASGGFLSCPEAIEAYLCACRTR